MLRTHLHCRTEADTEISKVVISQRRNSPWCRIVLADPSVGSHTVHSCRTFLHLHSTLNIKRANLHPFSLARVNMPTMNQLQNWTLWFWQLPAQQHMSWGPVLPTTASFILEDPRGLYKTSTCSTHSFTEGTARAESLERTF